MKVVGAFMVRSFKTYAQHSFRYTTSKTSHTAVRGLKATIRFDHSPHF